jgi:mRNA interferase MazF
MTGCEFGDVILVPFPFTDQSATKKRPAVVISSPAYHSNRIDLIVMPVTSQVRSSAAFAPREVHVQDWKAAGLIKPGVIKPVITTIERSLVLKKLGRLNDHTQAALRKVIAQIVG